MHNFQAEKENIIMEKVVERFLEYIRFNTRSDAGTKTHPSTRSQYDFAIYLAKELENMGLTNVQVDDKSYVTATLPANTIKDLPVIGFIAHIDTSPDIIYENINPRIVKNYNGGDIVLNSGENIVLSPTEFPDLLEYTGEDIIVTDGTTLLGADDKAGIAEIISAVEYLNVNNSIKHGTIRICFTPDEEIGEGADNFDVNKFGADFAYTIDGDSLGSLEYENFNAASATIEIKGRNIHPGSAKNKMVNSILIGMKLNSMLPSNELPVNTEGYEGFFHLTDFQGTVENTILKYLIRDHDMANFEDRKSKLTGVIACLNEKYGLDTIELHIKDQYYNMKEKIVPVIHIVELARKAMEQAGVIPLIKPIRGGTDGSRLSYMGLPTPNIFTGGHNYHGKYEYIPVNSMKKSVETIVKIIELSTK
jgi:tripeptide aminopeptidase